ncbi:MAG: flagellar export protein FliJ [Syntrophomonas sp.]|jgi:flagellar FliJ protein
MKAFKFRLQTSLNVSLRREQVAREELQACMAEKERVEEQLVQLNNKLVRLEDRVRELGLAQPMSQEALMHREYLPVLHKQVRQMQVRLARAEERVENARTMLLERKKESQSLERLREKEWQEYRHELSLEEQKVIDEVAISTHYRKNVAEEQSDEASGENYL